MSMRDNIYLALLNHNYVWLYAAIAQAAANVLIGVLKDFENGPKVGTGAGLLWSLASVRMYVEMTNDGVSPKPVDYLLLLGSALFTLSYNVPIPLIRPLVILGAICFLSGATFTNGTFSAPIGARGVFMVKLGALMFMIGAILAAVAQLVKDDVKTAISIASAGFLFLGASIWAFNQRFPKKYDPIPARRR